MRTKRVIEGLNNSQKIRVIIGDAAFYMTVGETDSRFGFTKHRVAVQHTLHLMVAEGCGGISHTVAVYDERMVQSNVQVQVDLV